MGFLKSQKECYFFTISQKIKQKLNKVCIHSKRNWQPGSYQFLLLFGKFTVDVLSTLSLKVYTTFCLKRR